MRIVSLLPSATEIVFELGLGDRLVAVSGDCDYPPAVEDLPRLTASRLEGGLSSREIDRAVKDHQHGGRSLYHLDADRLDALEPDLVLTQEQCEVCAPDFGTVREACRILEGDPTVVSLEAHSLSDIFGAIRTVGGLAGVDGRAESVVAGLQSRIDDLLAAVEPVGETGRILTLEWLDPTYAGGHWIPEMAEKLGFEPLLEPGDRSRELSVDEMVDHDPDCTVLMPCGFGLERTIEAGRSFLASVCEKNGCGVFEEDVYAVDGSSYFSRPGPRVVDGFEILARICHPDRVTARSLPDASVEKLV